MVVFMLGAVVNPPRQKIAQPQTNSSNNRKSSRGEQTKTKLLDAAELIFADRDYDGTSLRDIAEAADVHLSLSSYYFGTKETLFEEVVRRRAVEFATARLEHLAKINMEGLTASEKVRLLIEAYVTPIFTASSGRSKQHQAYVRIMARFISVKRWTGLIQRHYEQTEEAFLKRWREALPHAHETSLLNAVSFMVAAVLSTCSYADRFGTWLNTAVGRRRVMQDLISYSHAGFMSLEASGVSKAAQIDNTAAKQTSRRRSPPSNLRHRI